MSSLLLLAAAHAVFGQAVPPTQPIRVNVLRSLDFGPVIADVESDLGPAAWRGAASFEILGPPGATIQLVFTLPIGLAGDSGSGRIGVTFGPQSAGYSLSQSGLDVIAFDPRSPFRIQLPASGRAVVTIGGSARASRQLSSGRYVGSISLLVNQQ